MLTWLKKKEEQEKADAIEALSAAEKRLEEGMLALRHAVQKKMEPE